MPSTKQAKPKYGIGTTGEEIDVPLPSGNICLVKKAGPEELIQAGVMDSIDLLTGLVQTLHVDRVTKGKPGKAVQKAKQQTAFIELIKDRPRWEALVGLLNAITVYCVVEPAVLPVPEDGKRDPGKLYIDKVDLLDKVAILTAALGETFLGVEAVEPFRAGSKETVGSLDDGEDLPVPPQSVPVGPGPADGVLP